MPSAATNRRGVFLNCRFAVNGIQKASRLLVTARAACDMERAPDERNAVARPRAEGGASAATRDRPNLTVWSKCALGAGDGRVKAKTRAPALGRALRRGRNLRRPRRAAARAHPHPGEEPAGDP